MPAHTRIPNIPGEELTDPTFRSFLSQRVAELCGLSSAKFPGSQPVSFTASSIEMLEQKDFWVCEKSDGVRVLVFIVMNTLSGNQEVWLIDRKQRYFSIQDLHFPHWENMDNPLGETILDGELVIDIDPKTKQESLVFYAFDCLILNGMNIMKKPLEGRFGRLRDWIIKPFQKSLQAYPEWRDALPFQVVAKHQQLSYHISQIIDVHIPQLRHGHDGLIFTCAESEYLPGTDEKILKWKPPSENSIDFKLELRFPPIPGHGSDEPDYYAKPEFLLHTWTGGDGYEFYDVMDVEDDEWEKMKESEEQLDDRIVEVCWDTDRGTWRMLRIRDDKPHANHKTIMEKILISIEDGVELEALLSRCESIRAAWKARAQQKASGQPSTITNTSLPPKPSRQPQTPGNRPVPTSAGNGYNQPAGVVAGLKR